MAGDRWGKAHVLKNGSCQKSESVAWISALHHIVLTQCTTVFRPPLGPKEAAHGKARGRLSIFQRSWSLRSSGSLLASEAEIETGVEERAVHDIAPETGSLARVRWDDCGRHAA